MAEELPQSLGPKLGLLGEIWYYLKTYRRWWLVPMLVVLVLFGVLLIIAETTPVVSPFIYTLF